MLWFLLLLLCLAFLWLPFYVAQHLQLLDHEKYPNFQISFGTLQYALPIPSSLSNSVQQLSSFFKQWFRLGAYLGVLGMLICIVFLFQHFISFFFSLLFSLSSTPTSEHASSSSTSTTTPLTDTKLVMMIPGINIPFYHIWYLLIAIFFSAVVHEMGHAMCAVSENIKVETIGLLLYFCFPSAFVEMSHTHLKSKSPFVHLKVASAGIWHNFIFSILCYLFLQMILHSLVYTVPNELFIYNIQPHNALYHSFVGERNGFPILQYKVNRLNGKQIENVQDWNEVLLATERKTGFCLPIDWSTESEVSCCDEQQPVEDPRFMCFVNQEQKKSCLEVRRIIPLPKCNPLQHDCIKNCFVPTENSLFPDNEIIELEIDQMEKSLLYYGNPLHFYHQIVVANTQTRFFDAEFVQHIHYVLQYCFMISTALGVLNLAPVQYFDGEYIWEAVFHWLEQNHHLVTKYRLLPVIHRRAKQICMVLFIGNMIIAAYQTFQK